jgi:hypothetical protein
MKLRHAAALSLCARAADTSRIHFGMSRREVLEALDHRPWSTIRIKEGSAIRCAS